MHAYILLTKLEGKRPLRREEFGRIIFVDLEWGGVDWVGISGEPL
jgi:hypothetical protein